MAKYAKVMHRADIANKAEIPLASISSMLANLKEARVIISPEWGYFMLAKDFLRQFQLTYGAPKTEKLLKMFDEEGIDLSAFEVSLNDDAPAPSKESMLDTLTAYLNAQKKKLASITTEIEKLTEEKNALTDELAKFGQMATTALAA